MNRINRKETKWLVLVSALALMVAVTTVGLAKTTYAQKPIRIGGTLPLTGAFAETGKWVEKGYRYWAEEINSKGGLLGRKVELIIYDDASSVEKTVTLLEKAITVEKVDLLLGGYPGTACVAQMPVAERHKMAYVSMGGHMPSFLQGYKYSFGSPPLMGQWWAEGLGQWLKNLPPGGRPKSAAIITMNNVIGKSCRESIVKWTKELNISILVDEYYDLPLAVADTLVSKSKESGAEAMFANGFFGDGVLTVRSMKSLRYNPKLLYQSVGCLVPAWVEQLGEDANYVFSCTAIHHKLPYPSIKRLNEVCREKYGQKYAPDYFLFGYSWVYTLQKGVEETKSLDNTAIKDYLHTREIDLIYGKIRFDEKGLPPAYSYLTQILNGEVELVWPLGIASAKPIYPKPAWK
jgi:branched-chain amino acid transport system substrate-binding protein